MNSQGPLLERKTLSEQVYAHLRHEIMTHQIGFGEKLVNRDLQRRFGVSSTPVRDAINRLHTDGLIAEITNGGARVIPYNEEDALEVNEIFTMLCTSVVDFVIRKGALPALCETLADVLVRQPQGLLGNAYSEQDRAFHRAFFDLCGNARLRRLYDRYAVLMEMMVHLAPVDSVSQQQAHAQHEKIHKACLSGDAGRIKALIGVHYQLATGWFPRDRDFR